MASKTHRHVKRVETKCGYVDNVDITTYEKQNNLRIGSLKFKLRRKQETEVLLSSFDSLTIFL